MPVRADPRAPRIHGLLTRLATKLDEKCGLGPILFTLYSGADFSLQRASAGFSEQRKTCARRTEEKPAKIPCSTACGRGSVSGIFSVCAFRAARASKRFPRILQVS